MTSEREALDGHIFGPGQPCYGCSPDHPHGFRLKFERVGERITTVFVPGEHHQSAPGMMHGGLVSTLADELAAWAVIGLEGKFGFTASFDAKLLKPVRIGTPIHGVAWITRNARRIMDVQVELVQPVAAGEPTESSGAAADPDEAKADLEEPASETETGSDARKGGSASEPARPGEMQCCFRGSFRFVVLDRGGAERMIGGQLPPAWERFCR